MASDISPAPTAWRSVFRLRTVIIVFFVFILALTEVIAWLYYDQSITVAREEAAKHILAAGDKVELNTRLLTSPIGSLCESAPLLPGAGAKPEGFAHPLLGYLLTFLEAHPEAYSLYFGYADGDFFQIISLIGREGLAGSLKAPVRTRFALRRIATRQGQRTERWRFLNRNREGIGESPGAPATYDPRQRPWYTAAERLWAPVKTDLYVFSSTGSLGLTMAHRIPGRQGAVFGLDLPLDSLSLFLHKLKIGDSGKVFLFNTDGKLIAYPDSARVARSATLRSGQTATRRGEVQDLDDPVARAVFALSRQSGGPVGIKRIEVGGEHYLLAVRPILELGSRDDYMALVAHEADFLGQAARIRNQALFFAIGLLALGVPFLLLLSASITKNLARLTEEAERISQLELGSTETINSHIDEVNRLGNAVAHMRAALFTSCRYLPKSLVRQFIRSGTVPHLGGERLDITLLFTDVQNFTTLSEGMPPEDLMAAMSEYFEIVGQAILRCQGTIDKFIGDAVMAFWNAPLATENHVECACLAALRLSKASQELNERRRQTGGPVMVTRVGLHTGTAIVGNVGATDRMNYTALGPVVNMASRLEGLNKFYATRILVSHEVRDKAKKHFLFRSVDVVVPKGVKDPVAIFELVGAMPQSEHADVAAPRARLGFCSRWERAMTLYRTVQWDKALEEFSALREMAPDDFLAAMYCQRVRRLLQNKPNKDWKAVQKFMHK